MRFAGVYRCSFYLMLCLATLSLSIDAADQNPLAMLYPIAVAVAGAIAFVTVDRNPKLGLESGTADMIALLSLVLVYLELRFDENLLILAWSHWLVYIQIVMMFRPKTVNTDWRLFGISVVQVVVGGVISQSDLEGAALLAWAVCSLWVLALFTLHREAIRAVVPKGIVCTPSLDATEPYPRLLDLPFVLSAVRVALTTLALGGVIFLAMPRRPSMGSTTTGDISTKHLTGFDDDVQLGQLGEILENDSVVMTVSLTDLNTEARVTPKDEMLFRGVSLSRYTRGRWRRNAGKVGIMPKRAGAPAPAQTVVQQIHLEPTDNAILFALTPIYTARGGVSSRGEQVDLSIEAYDGSLGRQSTSPNHPYDYRIESDHRLGSPQPMLQSPDPAMRFDLSRIGEVAVSDRIKQIVEPLITDIPRTEPLQIARKLEAYLRDSGQFHYSLAMDVVDSSLDPVVDFLVNRKEGHCEYFASALALMLRSVGIPARLVNGFKGGDWNELSGTWVVRQKHAHSWVEVLVDPPVNTPKYATWVTLDPTPGAERSASVARVGGVSRGFRQFSDFARYVWAFYVVGFNAERQKRFLYDPIRELFHQARLGYQLLWSGVSQAFAWVFNFPSFGALISVRGFVVSFVGLLLLAGLVRLGFWVGGRVWRKIRGDSQENAMLATGTQFYRRLVDLLQKFGMERPPHETQREFATRAARKLSEMGVESQSVADVPPQIVDAYYRIRFGRHELSQETIDHLESRLDQLEERLLPASK